MQKCLKSMFTCAGYRVSDQNFNMFRLLDSNNDQRKDLMVFNFLDSKDCVSCIADASVTQKSSIEKGEYIKNRKYLADCEQLNVAFKTIIWEVFGICLLTLLQFILFIC